MPIANTMVFKAQIELENPRLKIQRDIIILTYHLVTLKEACRHQRHMCRPKNLPLLDSRDQCQYVG